MKKLTQAKLREVLKYESDTGIFKWHHCCRPSKKGHIAGSSDARGYIVISISGKQYKAHRLAWLYEYGYFPENGIDHINNKNNDNRISNLREVSHQCNMRNTKITRTNNSGVNGVVSRNKRSWIANITVDYKVHYLGTHKNLSDAVKARWEAEVKYDFPNCCTTSSAYNYLIKNGLIKEKERKNENRDSARIPQEKI